MSPVWIHRAMAFVLMVTGLLISPVCLGQTCKDDAKGCIGNAQQVSAQCISGCPDLLAQCEEGCPGGLIGILCQHQCKKTHKTCAAGCKRALHQGYKLCLDEFADCKAGKTDLCLNVDCGPVSCPPRSCNPDTGLCEAQPNPNRLEGSLTIQNAQDVYAASAYTEITGHVYVDGAEITALSLPNSRL